MKLEKLVKTLRRDLAANPLKAGVLGVLLLGGLYFWGPLVWKWVGKKGAAASDVAVVPVPDPSLLGAPGGDTTSINGNGENKEPELAWRAVRDRRNADPLARSADFRSQWSQLFQVATTVPMIAQPEAGVQAKEQVEVDPRDLGLVLQGVVIGAQVKKAMISGKVYRELDSITVRPTAGATSNEEAQQRDVVFKLVRIYRKVVVVECAGKIWELKLNSAAADALQPAEAIRAQPGKDASRDEKAFAPEKAMAAPLKE